MNINKLDKILKESGQASFRVKQIVKNYYSGRYKKFEEMTDLPKGLRVKLDEEMRLLAGDEVKILDDGDNQKALLKMEDGEKIETVLMNYEDWLSACLSTQVGCAMGCKFCATGKMGLKRNLTSEEIVDQVLYWNNKLWPKYVGRIVFMGMGEPFANWENVWRAINIIHDELGIGWRKISISTVGLIDKIYDFIDLKSQINLAISLHAMSQNIREYLIPVAKNNEINNLKRACWDYTDKTRRQLFFEYALIDGVNDDIREARKLAEFIKSNHLFFLNIIKLNPIGGELKGSRMERERDFLTELDRWGVEYSVRKSFGLKIKAGCGQLATE
jgi:23S rRNA (adenine2503-C2)-methyltransferase